LGACSRHYFYGWKYGDYRNNSPSQIQYDTRFNRPS
jgi:hypothetical protein